MIQRRAFLAGMFSAFAAPAIVRAASIMPVKVMPDLSRIHVATADCYLGDFGVMMVGPTQYQIFQEVLAGSAQA